MPKSRVWLIVNCVIIATGTTLSGFYIFRGGKICDDYIQLYKPGIYMALVKQLLSLYSRFYKVIMLKSTNVIYEGKTQVYF
jgi:hypothetical protein